MKSYIYLSIIAIAFIFCSCKKNTTEPNINLSNNNPTNPINPPLPPSSNSKVIADYTIATESVLRSIPTTYINAARNNLKIAYQHTSHGTHVSRGLYGLPQYKTGDSVLFGISNTNVANKLYFVDYAMNAPYPDLSTADANWSTWLTQVRTYLDNTANADINVVMWSWCDISNHNVKNYLLSMQTLISEYGYGGSKIGTGAGKTRINYVTFIFMTGHATRNNNVGAGRPKNQADTILAFCAANNYYCLDYYSIDTHDMDNNYWEDAGDNGDSDTGGNFYLTWQNSHTVGVDWYYNRSSIGGSVETGIHTNQHITSNRKAYAMWWILARIAGWTN